MSGDAHDLDALAEARLDGELDDAAWATLAATHGDALASALARASALRGALAGLGRPAMPEGVRTAVLAALPPAAPSAAAGAPARAAAPPLRFAWRAIVPAALAASLIVALLATLVVPWRASEPVVARGEPGAKRASAPMEAPSAPPVERAVGDERGAALASSDDRIAGGGAVTSFRTRALAPIAVDKVARLDEQAEKKSDQADDARSERDADERALIVAATEAPVAADAADAPTRGAAADRAVATAQRRASVPAKPAATVPAARSTVDAESLSLQVAGAAQSAPTDDLAAATPAPADGLALRERETKDGFAAAGANHELGKNAAAAPAPAVAVAPPAAGAPAPADVAPVAEGDADEALLAQARRFLADKEKAPTTPRDARKSGPPPAEEAPGPLALDLVVLDATQADGQLAYAKTDAAKAEAKPDVVARVFLVRITNRTVGVAPLPGGAPSLRGLDAAGKDVWSAPLHPAAQTVPADSEIHWQEPATGPLAPPHGVQKLRAQWGTLRSAPVAWTPAP